MPPPHPVLIRLDGMLTKIKSNIYALHNLDLPPRFKRGQLIIITYHGGGGDSENLKKGVEVWCRGWYFYLIFPRFIIFKFRNYFIHCKVVLYVVLCSTITSWKKSYWKWSKNEPKNIPYKLRFISLFVKAFKRLKIDF